MSRLTQSYPSWGMGHHTSKRASLSSGCKMEWMPRPLVNHLTFSLCLPLFLFQLNGSVPVGWVDSHSDSISPILGVFVAYNEASPNCLPLWLDTWDNGPKERENGVGLWFQRFHLKRPVMRQCNKTEGTCGKSSFSPHGGWEAETEEVKNIIYYSKYVPRGHLARPTFHRLHQLAIIHSVMNLPTDHWLGQNLHIPLISK